MQKIIELHPLNLEESYSWIVGKHFPDGEPGNVVTDIVRCNKYTDANWFLVCFNNGRKEEVNADFLGRVVYATT